MYTEALKEYRLAAAAAGWRVAGLLGGGTQEATGEDGSRLACCPVLHTQRLLRELDSHSLLPEFT